MTEPLEPLKPLDAKEQDEFDRRRESATVVQHKCLKCGAWYETPKRQSAYQEAFLCDCGNPISFTVPAIDLGQAAGQIDMDERFDTGMSVREAVANASYWWSKTGRRLMKKDHAKRSDFFSSPDPDNENFMPSAIINGEPWDQLDTREKLFLVKAWHHYFIRKPTKEN